MLHFTKYAEEKFEILNKYGVYFTREQVAEAVKAPDKVAKKGAYQTARKDGVKVVYSKEGDVIKIITFYPIK
jgi:hypothetical protein